MGGRDGARYAGLLPSRLRFIMVDDTYQLLVITIGVSCYDDRFATGSLDIPPGRRKCVAPSAGVTVIILSVPRGIAIFAHAHAHA